MNGVNALLRPETTKNCHAKLMTTGTVKDMKKSSHASTSRSEENEITIQEIFTCRPKKNLTSEFVLLKYVSCKQDN